MQLNSRIEKIIGPILERMGVFLIDISVKNSNTGSIVEVFIDSDEGITTDRCAEISRETGKEIDTANIFEKRYHLVVSSPGIDRPLKLPRQYRRNIGRTLVIKYREENSTQQIRGILTASDADGIALKNDDGTIKQIEFDHIIEARVQAAW